jgi:prepilin peptidase CpaA
MMPFAAPLFTLAAATVLLVGAFEDVRTRRISNRLVVVGLGAALLAALVHGGLAVLAGSVLAAGVALAIGFAGFAIGAVGGGDAKFLAVGAAFVGLDEVIPFFLAAAALGGVLAVVHALWTGRGTEATIMTLDLAKSAVTLGKKGYRGRLGDSGRMTIPYGLAIGGAALAIEFTPVAAWLIA